MKLPCLRGRHATPGLFALVMGLVLVGIAAQLPQVAADADAQEGDGGQDGHHHPTEPSYGRRKEGMYKWQRDKGAVKTKALGAKARRLGLTVEEVEKQDAELTR